MNQVHAFQERQTIENAVEALENLTGLDISWTQDNAHDNGVDAFMTFNNQTFPIEQKQAFSLSKIPNILQIQSKYPNLVLISDALSDNVKAVLRGHKINYLDIAGNAYIQFPNNLIFIEGKKTVKRVEKNIDKAFTKKGIVVVFHLLNDENLLNQTYRHISEVTGASLDTITKVIQSLKQQGFIVKKDAKNLLLIEKKRLFEKWADAYENRLKPHLFVGRFRFLTLEAENNWQNLALKDTTIWGGEPAADILTNYLHPGIYTLYSTETKAELIKNYRILPDKKGNVQVYAPFTAIQNSGMTSKIFSHAATPILTYADMLNSDSGRNHEVAQLIYTQYVEQFF